MFADTLPYSKNEFNIPVITFKDIFDIARLYYDENNTGVISLLEQVLNIKELNCIDKFFVICRACQVYITEDLSLNDNNGKQVNLSLSNIVNKLHCTTDFAREFNIGQIKLVLDVPRHLFTDSNRDVFSSVIHQIAIDGTNIDLHQLSRKETSQILSSLPAAAFNVIRKYISDLDLNFVLVDEIKSRGIDEINVNFLSYDPSFIIKALYSGFHLLTCRDIIYHLSRKIGGEALFMSTPNDINYYLEEFEKENKNSSGSSAETGIPGM